MTERIIRGGRTVAIAATNAPVTPKILCPIIIDAFTAMAPGDDWAMAIRSRISSSFIQLSSSQNFFFIRGTMTKPPPKVKALILKVDMNKVQYLLNLSFIPYSFLTLRQVVKCIRIYYPYNTPV